MVDVRRVSRNGAPGAINIFLGQRRGCGNVGYKTASQRDAHTSGPGVSCVPASQGSEICWGKTVWFGFSRPLGSFFFSFFLIIEKGGRGRSA